MRSLRNTLGIFFLGIWAAGLSVVFSLQTASHTVSLRVPENLKALQNKVLNDFEPGSGYAILHFVPDHCSCTAPLLEQLAAVGPGPGRREKIVFVGDASSILDRHQKQGFGIEFMAAETLEKDLTLSGLPALVIADESRQLRYVGGYFPRSTSYDSQHGVIVKRLMENETFAALPIFGCPAGSELRRFLNPFAMRD